MAPAIANILRVAVQVCAVFYAFSQRVERRPHFLNDLAVVKSAAAQGLHTIMGPTASHLMPFLQAKTDLARLKSSSSSYCDDDLGCFHTNEPEFWHPMYRPINFVPRSRESIRTKYLLYTRYNPKAPFALNPAAKGRPIKNLGPMDVRKKIKVIIQGWIDNPSFINWIDDMKDQLLLNDDVNVVIVDWKNGNGLPYTGAVANARVVGAELALLLDNLRLAGADLGQVHVIGHSLGSHVAGYAGERLPGLGRITGLDPAGPYFQEMPAKVRLDLSDARLVDVWHTDGGPLLKLGLGMDQAIGHYDFYPNGGKEQPGCSSQRITTIATEGLVMGIRRFLGCNHERAIQLYLEAINAYKGSSHGCRAWAYSCPDWDTFNEGHCATCGVNGQQCATMDHDLIGPGGAPVLESKRNNSMRFYLRTHTKAPYCLFHYQITLRMSSSGSSENGKLTLHVVDASGRSQAVDLRASNVDLHPSSTYRFLLTSGQPWELGKYKVQLGWKSSKILSFIFKPKINVQDITIKFMNPGSEKDSGNLPPKEGELWKFTTNVKSITSGETVHLTST